jgi:Glycosyl transferase 4-like domain
MIASANTFGTETDGRESLQVHFFVNFVHQQGTYFRYHNLAVGLTRLGHRVKVYASDINYRSRARREIREGVPYDIVPESVLTRLLHWHCEPVTAARRFARRYPPCDVAHLFQPFPCAAAGWVGARARVRFYDWDDLWSGGLMAGPIERWRDYWPRGVVRFLEHRLPRRADHVTAISSFLADRARERGAHGVTLLNSGSWPDEPPDRVAARLHLGLRPGALYVGFMGRTAAEVGWCFESLAESLAEYPSLRLAVCGPPVSCLDGLAAPVRERVDYLGQLSPTDARAFAACIDLGLLPLDDNLFNCSRLPQKFGDHLAAGVPLLCSTVGECGRLIGRFPWALPAGTNRSDWLSAFGAALRRLVRGDVPPYAPGVFRAHMSWEGLSGQLAEAYRVVLAGPSARRPKARLRGAAL